MTDRTSPTSELLKDATLRDFAAVEFMKALIINQGIVSAESDAKRAYSLADALLDEREKREELQAEVEAALNS